MRWRSRARVLAWASVLCAAACGQSRARDETGGQGASTSVTGGDGNGSGGAGASPSAGGTSGTAGAGTAGSDVATGGSAGSASGGSAAGGSAAGGSAAGDTASGGYTSGSGGVAAGGEAGGGSPSVSGGTGGAAGEAGSAAAGEGGMNGAPPNGSPGCALASSEVPDYVSTSMGIVRLAKPLAYDGVTPVPLLLMFHATNQINDYRALTTNEPGAARYLIAAPENREPGYFEDSPPEDYSEQLHELLDTFCIDESRVFGAGNGSGGRFLTTLLSARSRDGSMPPFRAAAMVGTAIRPRLGTPLPSIFIHALSSNNSAGVASDRDGLKALDSFLQELECSETNVPVAAEGCVTPTIEVDAGCVDFEGCAAPFRFCHHDAPDGSGDVWPCFASKAIYQFFEPYLPEPG